MSNVNDELADIFHRMAGCYRYLGPGERFRAIAYDTAARVLHGLKENIQVYATDTRSLDQISGIGESIAEKIIEYLSTGHIAVFEDLKKKVPEGLLELMDITGFGPATVRILHEQLNIQNKEDLVAALEKNRIAGIKGFGPQKIENLKRGLKLFKQGQERMLLPVALNIGNELLAYLRVVPGIKSAALAGSLRRRKETIGDIDIIVAADKNNWKRIGKELLKIPQIEKVLASGETKLSFLLKKTFAQIDIRLVQEETYGAALLYFTGSKDHNIKLRTLAKAKGWKVNEYGVFDIATGKKLAGTTEAEIYKLFGMEFIPPELREQKGEIELAMKSELPKLIEVKDIKGDMQMHSTWSDGMENIEAIAQFVRVEMPQYQYIVITDHSPSQRIAGGLQPEDFRKQFKEIDKINKKLGSGFIKKGVEVDILTDGSLDLADDLLAEFDWVVASVHSGFNHDNTERLIKAGNHPLVHCIGHPGGRLLGKRESYPVDWQRLFNILARTGTAIEINAQPERLDLKDDLVKEAVKNGVVITISTDAHMLSQFEYMGLGVSVARRGWCTRHNVLNAASWQEVEAFKKHKARLMQKKKLLPL